MRTLLIAASALALAGPALAQNAKPMTLPASATQPMPETDPNADATQSDATSADQAAAPVPAEQTAQTMIAADYQKYDTDRDGNLSHAEFDAWMVSLKAKSGKPITTAEKKAVLPTWFAKADTDKSKTVSLAEITTYLTAGA